MVIWLRYKNDTTQADLRLDALDEKDRTTTEREQGKTLRGVLFSHKIDSRRIYDVSIGADELCVASKLAFMEAFWEADRWWISLNNSTSVPDDGLFVECQIPSGDIPLSYVEGAKHLPTISFTMTKKHPN